jgi:hypothetical protein
MLEDPALEFRNASVLQFGRLGVFAARWADPPGGAGARALPSAAGLPESTPFSAATALQARLRLLEIGEFLLEALKSVAGGSCRLLAERGAFDFELHDAFANFVHFRRHRVDFHAKPGRGLVNEIDCLVRQESGRQCSGATTPRGDERGVLIFTP